MSLTNKRLALLAASVCALVMTGVAHAQVAVDAKNPPKVILTWTPAQQLERYPAMEKVYRLAPIKKGTKVRELPLADKQIAPKISGQDVDAWMKKWRVTGLIAVKDGKIVLEKYAFNRKPTDRWTSFSVGKSVTSTLIGAAVKDRYINNIYEPVTKYLPELEGTAYDGVSIRQLMTMTSGVKWNEDYTNPKSDVSQAGTAPWKPGEPDPILTYMGKLKREAPPGTKFVYKTGETDLAGLVLGRALAGKLISQYASEKIWAPYGMDTDAGWVIDKAGNERGGCCISMTLRDYARLGMFMAGGGKIDGVSVLPEGWTDEATVNQLNADAKGGPPNGYGYFWWPGEAPNYAASGVFGQRIAVFPEENLVIAINSAMLKATGKDQSAAMEAVAAAIRKELGG